MNAIAGKKRSLPRKSWLGLGVAAVLVAGAVGFGILRGGTDRLPISEAGPGGGFTGGDFHSLVADPEVSGRVFVGGHQAVSVSTDGGVSWSEVPSLANADAMGWHFDDAAVWVSGHPGIVKSVNDTDTVEKRNGALPDTDIHAFGGSEGTLFAAGPRVGVLRSTDDAGSWTQVSSTAGQSFFGRILVEPKRKEHLIAADPGNGVVESVDGGKTWKPLTATPVSWVSSPDGLKTLYGSGAQTAVKSTDAGQTWSPMVLPQGATTVDADPTRPDHLYAGAHDGQRVRLWLSTDGGSTWTDPQ